MKFFLGLVACLAGMIVLGMLVMIRDTRTPRPASQVESKPLHVEQTTISPHGLVDMSAEGIATPHANLARKNRLGLGPASEVDDVNGFKPLHVEQSPRPAESVNRIAANANPERKNDSQSLRLDALPNVIFMMADDMGYGDVHYNGGKANTPNLDIMVSGPNSIHFTRFYASAPVCSPTRGSVLTGRNPYRYCIWNPNIMGPTSDFTVPSKYPLPASEITVGEILKEHGYHTAVFGKWHIGDLKAVKGGHKKWPVSHPGMHGFDEWWVTPSSAPTFKLNCACFNTSQCPVGHYPESIKSCRNYYTVDSNTRELKGWPEAITTDDSYYMYERLSEFLKLMKERKRPYFVYFPFHTAHIRYLATPTYRNLYLARGHSLNEADYYGAISAMDEVVGLVRAVLRHHNMHDNTMLWFTSDNGPENDTPGETAGLRGRKYTLWEGGTRVPGIIEWPAIIKENRKSDFPVVTSDLLPTMCDILGVDPPMDRPIDGMSILPFLRGEMKERNTSIAWQYTISDNINGGHAATLIRGPYKLYASYNGDKLIKTYLYDVVKDRSETKDISADHKDLVQSMKTELNDWKHSVRESATKRVKCM